MDDDIQYIIDHQHFYLNVYDDFDNVYDDFDKYVYQYFNKHFDHDEHQYVNIVNDDEPVEILKNRSCEAVF